MICKFCNKEIKEGSAFCPECGQKLIDTQETPVVENKVEGATQTPEQPQQPASVKNVYYNPYAQMAQQAQQGQPAKNGKVKPPKNKFKGDRKVAWGVCAWVFFGISLFGLLLTIISYAITGNVFSDGLSDPRMIVFFIFFGWIFFVLGYGGGMLITIICAVLALIFALIQIIRTRFKGGFSWTVFVFCIVNVVFNMIMTFTVLPAIKL